MKAIGCLVALLLATPMVQAVVLEDPAGDVAVHVREQEAAPVPAGIRDSIDILSLDVVEEGPSLVFIVDVMEYRSLEEDDYVDRIIWLRFDVGSREYGVTWGEITGGGVSSGLYLRDGFSPWGERVGDVTVTVDQAEATYRLAVAKAKVTGGDILENIDVRVLAHGGTSSILLSFVGFLVFGEWFLVVVQDQAGFTTPGIYRMSGDSPTDAQAEAADEEGTTGPVPGTSQEAPGPAAALLVGLLLLLCRRRR